MIQSVGGIFLVLSSDRRVQVIIIRIFSFHSTSEELSVVFHWTTDPTQGRLVTVLFIYTELLIFKVRKWSDFGDFITVWPDC